MARATGDVGHSWLCPGKRRAPAHVAKGNCVMSLPPYIAAVLVVVAFLVVMATIKIVRQYERAVVFTLGRFQGVKGPGLVLLVPFFQEIVRVDLRIQVIEIPDSAREICYRFCYLNEAGNIANCEDRECAGDLAALVYARSLARYQTIEIWDGTYRVAHIAKGEDPLKIDGRAAGWHRSFPT